MSFDMKTKDIQLDKGRALECLAAWSQELQKSGVGTMTVNRNGESIKIRVTQTDAVELDVGLSEIKVHHTYKYVHEICSSGCPEMSKHYNVVISGEDAQSNPVRLGLYINHTCEDGATWQKSLSVDRPR